MTPAQIALARNALGLPNPQNRSYRNRYCAGKGHPDHAKWKAMVAAGLATVRQNEGGLGGQDTFSLTVAGATAALQKGETLSAEGFPGHD
ncbi:hypothetical protein [Cypionkella sp.]|uniref:hypothetical protein n=1 Tax=Cypionkella sp. TaxID=2811411 RepID=UPI002ABA2C95|nr:hypothetical protein [Cypionkella sp.]MDZ4393785.1 hypothetical protein [Cypionkella sp.]